MSTRDVFYGDMQRISDAAVALSEKLETWNLLLKIGESSERRDCRLGGLGGLMWLSNMMAPDRLPDLGEPGPKVRRYGGCVQRIRKVLDGLARDFGYCHPGKIIGGWKPSTVPPSLILQLGKEGRRLAELLSTDLLPGRGNGKPRNRRRGKKGGKLRPLTDKQAEVVQIVGECEGNIAKAASRLGRDRKTVDGHYRAAMSKLGKTVVKSRDKTRVFLRDKRGQEIVCDDDDRRF